MRFLFFRVVWNSKIFSSFVSCSSVIYVGALHFLHNYPFHFKYFSGPLADRQLVRTVFRREFAHRGLHTAKALHTGASQRLRTLIGTFLAFSYNLALLFARRCFYLCARDLFKYSIFYYMLWSWLGVSTISRCCLFRTVRSASLWMRIFPSGAACRWTWCLFDWMGRATSRKSFSTQFVLVFYFSLPHGRDSEPSVSTTTISERLTIYYAVIRIANAKVSY